MPPCGWKVSDSRASISWFKDNDLLFVSCPVHLGSADAAGLRVCSGAVSLHGPLQACTDWRSHLYLWHLIGAAAGKTYLRPHVGLSERPAESSLLWSLCAGGNAGPGGLAHSLPSPDAQRSGRHSSSRRRSTAPSSRLPTRYPGKGALNLCLSSSYP